MRRPLLIVEDNAQDEFFILRALDRMDQEIPRVVARDGEEALRRLVAPLPCAVFLDIMLPRVNGWAVLRQIRASSLTRHLPVIMFSSSAEPKDLEASYEFGANAYVQKGSDIEAFSLKIHRLAAFWVLANSPL